MILWPETNCNNSSRASRHTPQEFKPTAQQTVKVQRLQHPNLSVLKKPDSSLSKKVCGLAPYESQNKCGCFIARLWKILIGSLPNPQPSFRPKENITMRHALFPKVSLGAKYMSLICLSPFTKDSRVLRYITKFISF